MERKYVGVLINVLGSLAINLGNNLQSAGHRGSHHGDESSSLDELNSKYEKETAESHKKKDSSKKQIDRKFNFTSSQAEDSINKDRDNVEGDEEGGYSMAKEEKNEFLWALLDCSGGEAEGSGAAASKLHVTSTIHKKKEHVKKAAMFKIGSTSIVLPLWLQCSRWLLGTCLFLSGTIAVFISYSFAPQSLIAPLGSVQFVSNIFFAKLIHKSPITKRMLVATSVILCGISLVVHYSPDPNPEFAVIGGESIRDLYFYYNYQIYMYTLGCIAISSHILYIIYTRSLKISHRALPFDKSLRPLCYALLSAVVGTQSTLQAKCLSELLIRADASGAFTEWFTYLSFAEFLLTTAFWLYRLNRALALFEPLFIIPVLQVFWTCFATLNGGIFFREFFGEVFLTKKIYGFVSGMVVIFLGVYLLAPNHSEDKSKGVGRLDDFSSSIKEFELKKMPASSSSLSSGNKSSSSSTQIYSKLSQYEADERVEDEATTTLASSVLTSNGHNIEKGRLQQQQQQPPSKKQLTAIQSREVELDFKAGDRPDSLGGNSTPISTSSLSSSSPPATLNSISGLIASGAKSLLFGEEDSGRVGFGLEEEYVDPLETFTPTLNGLLVERSESEEDESDSLL